MYLMTDFAECDITVSFGSTQNVLHFYFLVDFSILLEIMAPFQNIQAENQLLDYGVN